MELLDKGNYYASRVKDIKSTIILSISVFVGFLIVSKILTQKVDMFSATLFFLLDIFVIVKLYIYLRCCESNIKHIDKNTVKIEECIIRTQIVSKYKESDDYALIYNNKKSLLCVIDVRTDFDYILKLYSESLYVLAKEGEYVDILIKYKLDKYGNVLDKSFVPLIGTIKKRLYLK